MGKVLNAILSVVEGPVTGLITGGTAGAIRGLQNVAVALSGPVAFGLYAAATIIGSLAKTPKPPSTETALKSPIPPRVSGYGRNRLHMTFCLYLTSSDGTAFDVGAFHDGLIDGIEIYYLGDKKITLGGGGWVNEDPDGSWQPGNTVLVGTTLGPTPNVAFSNVVAALPDQWTDDHRGDGVVTAFVRWGPVKTKDFQKTYPTGGPNSMSLSMAMRLQLVFDWRDETQSVDDPGTWKWSENACLHTAHYKLVREKAKRLATEAFPSGAALLAAWNRYFVPTLDYWTDAANDCDIPVPLKGVQTILTAAFNHGHITMALASVEGLMVGMTVVISATGDTSLAETRTVVSISGLDVVVATIDNDHPIGSQVTWASDPDSPATEARYRSCVAHQHTDPHKGVIANLLACFDGWLAPRSDGALVIYSGRFYEPTVTIGPDEIVSYSIQDGVAEESAINQIAVTYISANHDFSQVDTDAWEDTDDIDNRGKVLATTLSNQVPSFSQGRRLAKRAIAETMAPKRGVTTTNAAGRIAIGQRFVRQTIVEAGMEFMDAVVQITKLTRNIVGGGVTYEWFLADPNIDEWNPATEEGNPAPVGNSVATEPLDAPTITLAQFFGSDNSGSGTAGARIRISGTGPDRPDLTWYARWRVVGAAVWNEQQYSDIAAGAAVTLETGFVAVDSDIEVQIAYQVGDGRVSPYSDPPTTVMTGSVTSDMTSVTSDTTSISSDRT